MWVFRGYVMSKPRCGCSEDMWWLSPDVGVQRICGGKAQMWVFRGYAVAKPRFECSEDKWWLSPDVTVQRICGV